MTVDLLSDERLPLWLREYAQSCSFEAETLASIGVKPGDGTRAGDRFQFLHDEAKRIASIAAPYIYGNIPVYGGPRLRTGNVSWKGGCGCRQQQQQRQSKSNVFLIGSVVVVLFCGCCFLFL